MTSINIQASQKEIKVAKLYLFFLPFRMILPFAWLKDFIGPLGGSFDLLFHIFGLILWAQNAGGFRFSKCNRALFDTIKNSILILNISSVFMSAVMFASYGDLHGKSPFTAIIPMILFYFHYLFMFLYNIRVFSILNYGTIINQLRKSCITLLCLAYIQVAVMLGIGSSIYDDIVNIIGGINTSSMLPKLCLTVSEGAAAGCLMGILIFPFILSRIIHGDRRAKYELFLWLIPLYFTHSSTAIILFTFDIFLFMYLMVKKSAYHRKIFVNTIGFFSFIGICALGLFMSGLMQTEIIEDITYLLFEKAGDQENGSTISRSVPFILNWGCFTEMPLFGVGNGLQGYFFNKYFPMQYLFVEGSDVGVFYEKAQTGIANGGCFWLGYLSGYGILGIIILLVLISKFRASIKYRSKNLGLFREMYIMGSLCFFPLGMQGEAYSLYYAWFVLSIPFMYFRKEELWHA